MNYTFLIDEGRLYVGTSEQVKWAVKPVLNCIEELEPGYFVANFEYENRNDEPVYIPVGPDNQITGTDIFWEDSDAQPQFFVPGGGTFRIFFGGEECRWILTTNEKKGKTSNAARASSSSTKCNKNTKSAFVSTEMEEELITQGEELNVYPNPVVEKLYLEMEGIEQYEMIQVFDLSGKSFPVTSIVSRTDMLEIDMSELASGPYYIRVVLEDTSKVVTVIKQ